MADHAASLRMDGVGDSFPSSDLLWGPNTRAVGHAGVGWGDEGCFGDEESSRNAGALGVVFDGKRLLDVVLVCAQTGEWRHGDAVSKVHDSYTDRSEEFGA